MLFVLFSQPAADQGLSLFVRPIDILFLKRHPGKRISRHFHAAQRGYRLHRQTTRDGHFDILKPF